MTDLPITYRYVGPHKFHGIPARDLTEADVDRLTIDQKRDLWTTSSYEPVTPDEDAPPDPARLSRSDLEAYAASLGIENPGDYANKDQLLEAVRSQTGGA